MSRALATDSPKSQLTADLGLAAATVDRIADTADVSRATFFRYFNSKDDAVAQGHDRALD